MTHFLWLTYDNLFCGMRNIMRAIFCLQLLKFWCKISFFIIYNYIGTTQLTWKWEDYHGAPIRGSSTLFILFRDRSVKEHSLRTVRRIHSSKGESHLERQIIECLSERLFWYKQEAGVGVYYFDLMGHLHPNVRRRKKQIINTTRLVGNLTIRMVTLKC